MNIDNEALLIEIRDLLKDMVESQKRMEQSLGELKEEHRKLREEVKLSNFVLNSINMRTEIVN